MATGMRRACYNNLGSYGAWRDLAYASPTISQAYQDVYYVDGTNGNDGNTGKDWDNAFATIDYAATVAAYSHGTTALDYTDKRHRDAILIAPGHYNEGPLFTVYNTDIIGCSPAIPGKDYGVSINYDGAVASTAVFGIMGSGNLVANLHLYCDFAGPAIYMANGDNNYIVNCVIEGDNTNMTYGIQSAGMKGAWIRDCVIYGAVTAGIGVIGAADKYAIHGGIENCQIMASATGAKGIYVDGNNVVYNFRIHHNFIELEGAGATAKGIDVDPAGNVLVTDNYINIETSATAVEVNGHGILHNHVSTNGTVTDPFDDD